MAAVRETSRLTLGKGCEMIFKVDDSIPKDSVQHHWAETNYDGKPDSWCPVIGSHWHKYHDEWMQVLSGRMSFTLDSKEIILTPSDPPLHIPRLHVHSFHFIKGVPASFTERTNPAGDWKEDFFTTLTATGNGEPNLLSVARSFYDGDTFIALPGHWKWLDVNVTWLLAVFANWWAPKEKPMRQPADGVMAAQKS